tara:strand:- start:5224 stop:5850 length:627 start_codon:yes stop_codon:yes gene_type:complete
MYANFFKRILDFIISLITLVMFSPVILLFIILLSVSTKGKPFFLQKRPGKNSKIFTILKFRTMKDLWDTEGNPLPDHLRITRIGAIMRKASLDELLQLINVLKGEMSIIGPRPLLIEYLPLYNEIQAQRHNVKPGITGWAQVNGRNSISWEEKFEYDVWYVNNLSLKTDLTILLKTIKIVLGAKGVSASESITMEAFKGTHPREVTNN